jgi:hypothetical protein
MKNVEMTVHVDDILTIKVDLSKEYGPSSSGKTWQDHHHRLDGG